MLLHSIILEVTIHSSRDEKRCILSKPHTSRQSGMICTQRYIYDVTATEGAEWVWSLTSECLQEMPLLTQIHPRHKDREGHLSSLQYRE